MNDKPRKILRRPVVRDLVGLSDSTIDRKEKNKEFPERINITERTVGWYEDEIQEYINNLPRGLCKCPNPMNEARKTA